MAPSFERSSISGFIPNERDANIDSKITIGNPTEIADSRNRNGRIGVCHSGCIFGPAITISVPSDDWCSVESTTPANDEDEHHPGQSPLQPAQGLVDEPVDSGQGPGRATWPMNLSVTIGRNSM